MKAYIIKNKEGKYKKPHLDIREFYTDILAEAEIWIERKDAEYFCPQDCEVVEITIAEGDLEQQIAIYRRALELACYYMEYEYPKKNDDIYYRKAQELEMIFIKQAKKGIKGEEK